VFWSDLFLRRALAVRGSILRSVKRHCDIIRAPACTCVHQDCCWRSQLEAAQTGGTNAGLLAGRCVRIAHLSGASSVVSRVSARRVQVSVSKKPLYFYVNLAKARTIRCTQ